jgi:putative endopeptidase
MKFLEELPMRSTLALLAVCAAAAAASPAFAQEPPATRSVPGFDAGALDRGVEPCTDFYRFSCGGWIDKNPVPSDRSRWGRFHELADRNLEQLKVLLEKVAGPDPKRAPVDQKIGDAYASCMDEPAVEKKGAAPLKPHLDRIARITTKPQLAREVAALHLAGVGALFQSGSQPDFKDASVNIAAVDQGGLSLPDRDYYVKDDARFADVRKQYGPHVQKMFELAGRTPAEAAKAAATVMGIETDLAQGSLERVKRRDPANRYHKMKKADLVALAPRFDWDAYFTALHAPTFAELNVSWPDFFKALNGVLTARSLDEVKTYLAWHAIRDAAPLLSSPFVQENFNFFGKALTGAKELRPRWKRCVDLVDNQLGEALGQRYVEATFGAEGKERMARMVEALEKALEKDIRQLSWMTDETKGRAQQKLAAVANKIGYPEKWRDYAGLRIVRGDLLGNAERAQQFEQARDLSKIGKTVDPTEWRMTPPTVNAYYSALENNINFPAGILQPPFFDRAMDDAVNFGAIGSVIGHELTHGFDDQGRKFDPKGNFSDWWTEADGKEFEKRASCVADQYSEYTVAGGQVKVNGRLTLGENVADNGGVRIALLALQDTLAGREVPARDGFTPEQRLFLGWGQIWCETETEESAKLRAQVDPHSPGRYRVNGVVSNMPEFQNAFGCQAGQPMVRENACRVW